MTQAVSLALAEPKACQGTPSEGAKMKPWATVLALLSAERRPTAPPGHSRVPAGPLAAPRSAGYPHPASPSTTSSLTAKAGKLTIAFTNSAPLAHNLTIASVSGKVVGATPTFQGGSKTLSVNLKLGTYTFYCSVPGHRQAGMQGGGRPCGRLISTSRSRGCKSAR
jgi:hypothetical protein